MKAFFILTATFYSLFVSAAVSDIKNYDYICTHITKAEVLVFKTSFPQKIWRTGLNEKGSIKIKKAFQLSQVKMNYVSLKEEGQVASFKAQLAKDYEIKGLFIKETDGEIPLTVISSYKLDPNLTPIKDRYNCSTNHAEIPIFLGSVEQRANQL